MSLINVHSDFRAIFALTETFVPTAPDPVQFTAPNLIVQPSGGAWSASNIEAGMRIQPVGTASNDLYFTAATVVGNTITTEESNVTTEGPLVGSVVINGVFVDPDGLERWPVQLLRSGGFAAISGFTVPYNGVTMTVTVNGQAADAVPSVDEYDWYVSQRTDVFANQYILKAIFPPTGGDTFSGTLLFVHSLLAQSEFGIQVGENMTADQLISLFRHMAIYVRRRSDGAIQFTDLLQIQMSNTQP